MGFCFVRAQPLGSKSQPMRWPSRKGLVPGGGAGPGKSLLGARQRLRAEATLRLLWTVKAVVAAGERTRVEGQCFERGLEPQTLLWMSRLPLFWCLILIPPQQPKNLQSRGKEPLLKLGSTGFLQCMVPG